MQRITIDSANKIALQIEYSIFNLFFMNRMRSKRGGGPLPLEYFGTKTDNYTSAMGADLLATKDAMIRPRIGGRVTKKRSTKKRSTKKHSTKKHRTHRTKGGFVPSVMEGFTIAASKYIVPLVLFAGYKMINKSTRKHRK